MHGRSRAEGLPCEIPGFSWAPVISRIPPTLLDAQALGTDVETMQSNERAFRYWAAGVGPAYLEGAFRRATSRAAEGSTRLVPPLSPLPRRAVLDPFEVDAQGEGFLAAQLRALDLDRIRDIAEAYELVPPKMAAFATRAELIVEILATIASARREPAER